MDSLRKSIQKVLQEHMIFLLEGQSKIVVVPSETTKVFPDIDETYANFDGRAWSVHDKFGWLLGYWSRSNEGRVFEFTEVKYGVPLSKKVGFAKNIEQAVRLLYLLNQQKKSKRKINKSTD